MDSCPVTLTISEDTVILEFSLALPCCYFDRATTLQPCGRPARSGLLMAAQGDAWELLPLCEVHLKRQLADAAAVDEDGEEPAEVNGPV